jgi:hypothetical protein
VSAATSFRTTAASSLRGERMPLSRAVGGISVGLQMARRPDPRCFGVASVIVGPACGLASVSHVVIVLNSIGG